jgi:hypothetical protein
MKKINLSFILAAFTLMLTLESCQAITGIFKAGVWVGIIIVVVVVALILWLIGKAGKK